MPSDRSSPADIDVTVSIVNHENRDRVLACLRGLAADETRKAKLQVIIVDNASTDGSAPAVRSAFPAVELITQSLRRGFGANHNAALRRARGRHLLLLNDDTLVRPGAVDALAGYLDQHNNVALAAPRVVDRAGSTQPSAWKLPAPRRDTLGAITLGRLPRPLSTGDSPRRVGWAMGCALLVRRDAMQAVGGFDESYFMYSEETELALRFAALGLETHWVPQAVVEHQGQASTGGHGSAARAVEMARSRRRYWDRHYSPSGRLIAKASLSIEFLALALASRLRGRAGEPFWIQARECWTQTSIPGLREQAAAWNARAPIE